MSSRIAAILGFTAMFAAASPVLGQDLSSLWPNDDGNSWTYQQSYEVFFPDPQVGNELVRGSSGHDGCANCIVAQALREELLGGPSTTRSSTRLGRRARCCAIYGRRARICAQPSPGSP